MLGYVICFVVGLVCGAVCQWLFVDIMDGYKDLRR